MKLEANLEVINNLANQKGFKIPVIITVFSDKSFTFETKTPPTSGLLLAAIKKDKGSAKPNRDKLGTLPMKTIEDIAKQKIQDLNTENMEAAIRSVLGTARSMGIDVA